MLNGIWTKIRREPIVLGQLVVVLIEAVIGLLMFFGLDVTPEFIADSTGVVMALAHFLAAIFARAFVTPVNSPKGADGRTLYPPDRY